MQYAKNYKNKHRKYTPPKKTAVELNKEFSEEKNNNWLRNILKVLYYSLANKCCQRYREWKTPRNC